MRLFLVDPGLITLHGHHPNYDLAVSTAAQALGIETHVFCNRQAEKAALAGLSATPAFSHSPYLVPALRQDASVEDFFNALRVKEQVFLEEMTAVVTPLVGSDDVLFAHTVFIPELQALVRWYRSLPTGRRPRLAVLLRWEPEAGFLLVNMPEQSVAAHGELIRQLDELGETGCVAVVADTPMLTSAYRSISGSHRIQTIPTPVLAHPTSHHGRRSGFAYVGEVSPDKGVDIALGAASLLARHRPDIQFRFQSGRNSALQESQARYPNVQFLPGKLQASEYLELIDSAIAVLTLYDPASYRRRTSGVFTEAACRGTMCISSTCGSISTYLEQMECSFLITGDRTPEAVAEKIIEVYDNQEEYGNRFRAASSSFAAYHCGERLVRDLMAYLGMAV